PFPLIFAVVDALLPVLFDTLHQQVDLLVPDGRGGDYVKIFIYKHPFELLHRLVCACKIGFVDYQDIGDFGQPGLHALNFISHLGVSTTTTMWASAAISSWSCPTPMVSTKMTSLPAASSRWMASRTAAETPPWLPRVAKLRIK